MAPGCGVSGYAVAGGLWRWWLGRLQRHAAAGADGCPACGYDHVYVTVDSVKVHQSASAGENDPRWYPITLPSLPKRIDLLELRNGLLAAEAVALAALHREESRGAHQRTDHPQTKDHLRRSQHVRMAGEQVASSFATAAGGAP